MRHCPLVRPGLSGFPYASWSFLSDGLSSLVFRLDGAYALWLFTLINSQRALQRLILFGSEMTQATPIPTLLGRHRAKSRTKEQAAMICRPCDPGVLKGAILCDPDRYSARDLLAQTALSFFKEKML